MVQNNITILAPKDAKTKDLKEMVADYWILPRDFLRFIDKNDLELVDETPLIRLSTYNELENNVFIKVDLLP
jgi:hypothetical protein